MGLSGIYNPPVPHEDGVALVKAAFGAGVTFFDTADAYGPHTNEVLLGKVGNFFSFPLYLIPSAGAILSNSTGWRWMDFAARFRIRMQKQRVN